MRRLITIAFLLSVTIITAQDDKLSEEISMDVLMAPSSPGFILLNQQPSDIERPTDPTDLMVGLRNATENFSAIPSNYALEMSPFWLFGGKNISFTQFTDTANNICNTLKQSLLISTAFGTNDKTVPGQRQISLGLKFSLLRGQHLSPEFLRANNERMNVLSQLNDMVNFWDKSVVRIKRKYDSLIKLTNPSSTELDRYLKEAEDSTNYYKNKVLEQKDIANYETRLKKLSGVKLKRYGWFLDLAGGVVTEYKNNVWDSVFVPKFGVWATFGYSGRKNASFLLLIRDIYQDKELYKVNDSVNRISSVNHLDGGVRFIFEKNKFSVSLEGLVRYNVFPTDMMGKYSLAWKSMLNLGYDLGENKILSFNIGRDFDGTVSKGGNIIAAINLVVGLGSKRQLN